MLRSRSVRRALTGALSLAVITGVGAGPLAGSALAAKPKTITDLTISATVPDASGSPAALSAGQATRSRSATFTFASVYDWLTSVLPPVQPKTQTAMTTAKKTFHAVVMSCWAVE